MRELRETIVTLIGRPGDVLCAECVATALGQSVGSVMMAILGLAGQVTSSHGVCSRCHRRALVIGRAAPGNHSMT